jgi:hypothetical protein
MNKRNLKKKKRTRAKKTGGMAQVVGSGFKHEILNQTPLLPKNEKN